MKRLFTILLAVLSLLSLTACGGSPTEETSQEPLVDIQPQEPEAPPEPTPEELAAQEARRAAEPADDWAKPYIETAIQAGILDGVEDGQGGITIARPKSNPTREEMATMGVALLRSNRS